MIVGTENGILCAIHPVHTLLRMYAYYYDPFGLQLKPKLYIPFESIFCGYYEKATEIAA